MIDYIKEYCEVPSLEEPLFDKDSETWDLWFNEKKCEWFPYNDEEALICLPFETKEDAEEAYRQSNKLINE